MTTGTESEHQTSLLPPPPAAGHYGLCYHPVAGGPTPPLGLRVSTLFPQYLFPLCPVTHEPVSPPQLREYWMPPAHCLWRCQCQRPMQAAELTPAMPKETFIMLRKPPLPQSGWPYMGNLTSIAVGTTSAWAAGVSIFPCGPAVSGSQWTHYSGHCPNALMIAKEAIGEQYYGAELE